MTRVVYVVGSKHGPVIDLSYDSAHITYASAKLEYQSLAEQYGEQFTKHNVIKKVTITEEIIED